MTTETSEILHLLRRYNLKADKRLGQNFLVNPQALQAVVQSAGIAPDDAVLEIGPGLGNLTRLLASQARRVVAVEVDTKFLLPLREILAPYPNVHIVPGDILTLDPTRLMEEDDPSKLSPYLVVANIPYYITSALIRHLLETKKPPQRLVLTVQREVAQRMCAAPGKLSLLSLSVQVYGKAKIAAHIPAQAFYPAPQVDSSVVRVDLHPEPAIPSSLRPTFFRLIKAGFSQKRKTMRNALAGGMHWTPEEAARLLASADIEPNRRAETLSLMEWNNLALVVKGAASE